MSADRDPGDEHFSDADPGPVPAEYAAPAANCPLAAMAYDELLYHAQLMRSAALALVRDGRAVAIKGSSYQVVEAQLLAVLEHVLRDSNGGAL